ncbi:hypothetical protein NP493_329g00018 [Ridgeia piscesae]|uniref:Uncharacterized protein n=1 Tax=Ridgeia piscesae TaxID=27915 RepID=A0AAD9L502_RIDPI|nr:hypothetical protein NP493_329g00018 [Ridgeia piscesae]
MDRGEESSGKRVQHYVDGVLTHAYERLANSGGDVTTDILVGTQSAAKQRREAPYDAPTVPRIIVSPPSTTGAAPATDFEAVKAAKTTKTTSLDTKTCLKPDVLYSSSASIESADVCHGYPRRATSRSVKKNAYRGDALNRCQGPLQNKLFQP